MDDKRILTLVALIYLRESSRTALLSNTPCDSGISEKSLLVFFPLSLVVGFSVWVHPSPTLDNVNLER